MSPCIVIFENVDCDSLFGLSSIVGDIKCEPDHYHDFSQRV